jgi:flagellar biosynthetic protein FliR
MLTVTSAQLTLWIASLLLPLTRILGLIVIAPVFGDGSMPNTIKLSLGLMLALIFAPMVAPGLAAQPAFEPVSLSGILLIAQELFIGMAMGLAVRISFMAIMVAAEVTSMTMGFNFASFFDPNSQGQSAVISQFLIMLTTLIFISLNGHLLLLSTLGESFTSLPVGMGNSGLSMTGSIGKQLVDWSSIIFSTGVQLSLPMVGALLISNIALGILTRAAPQLNLFGIGFPIMLASGFVVIALALPYLAVPIQRLLGDGLDMAYLLVHPR